MNCRCRGCCRWHFELRGWRQIVGFDLLVVLIAVIAFWAGYLNGLGAR